MARIDRLFAMSEEIREANVNVILIQIDEAHSSAWPMALDDQPNPQSSFEERVERANLFVEKYKPPFAVYIDGWDNIFAETFRAWPDKYHCVDNTLKVIAKAEYGMEHVKGEKEAVVLEDYTVLLKRLIGKK